MILPNVVFEISNFELCTLCNEHMKCLINLEIMGKIVKYLEGKYYQMLHETEFIQF